MLDSILSRIICTEYQRHFQRRLQEEAKLWPHTKGLLVRFSISRDHEREEGYREFHLLVYGEKNYVGVYTQECWDVAPIDENGELTGDYEKGSSEWTVHGYHDSCWRDAVGRVLFSNSSRLNTVLSSRFSEWYELIEIGSELVGELKLARDKRYN